MADHDHDHDPDAGAAGDGVDPFAMTCAELVELVTDYLEGTLPEASRTLVDAHLGVCPPCVHVIDQWRTVIALTGHLDEDRAVQLPADQRAQLMAAFRGVAR